jgi:hypothetical protein
MKKILILLGVLVVALTLGTAYADSKDMSAGVYNGITEFAPIPVASHDLGSGLVLANGVTAFDFPKIEYGAEGAAAGGLRTTMEPSMELRNGITVFDTDVAAPK